MALSDRFDLSGRQTLNYIFSGGQAKLDLGLFKTDNQKRLEKDAEADIDLKSRYAYQNLEQINQSNLEMSDTSLEMGTGQRRNRTAQTVAQQFAAKEGGELRAQVTSFMRV